MHVGEETLFKSRSGGRIVLVKISLLCTLKAQRLLVVVIDVIAEVRVRFLRRMLPKLV